VWELASAWFAEALRQDSMLTGIDADETMQFMMALADPNERTIAFHETRKFLRSRGINAEPGSPSFRRLCGSIREAMVQRERNLLIRFSAAPGLLNPRFADISVAAASPKPSVTFQELLARFRHHQQNPRSLKTVRKRTAQDRTLCDILGADTPIDKIVRDDARRVQETVSQRRTAATANTYLAALTAVMKFAVDEGLLASSPASGLKLPSEGISASELRLPFTDSELKRMFSSVMPGADVYPSRRWLPVLGLYTGARLGELANLRRNDIVNIDGITAISIHGQLKTAASKRIVPVHPELQRLGFIDFVNEVKPDARLFVELKMSADGYLSEQFSKLFGQHLRNLGINIPRRRSFHSFRHNFRKALAEADIAVETVNQLCGWSGKSMSSRYGGALKASILARAVGWVRYEGLTVEGSYTPV
jgi:integrase